MAVIKAGSSKATPSKINAYLTQEEKTNDKLISGMNCNPETMVEEFQATKELYDKNGGVKYHHIIQSFSPEDDITPEKAHKLALELAEKRFKGYEVFIVTHTDKEHIHNHFVINSVSYETGLKYKASNKSLWDIKRESNRICEREHLKTIDLEHKGLERLTSGELRMELRGKETWKGDLRECINYAKEKCTNLDQFRQYLKDNFNIDTRVTKKTISYKHPSKEKPIRGSKLGASYDKEELSNEFIRREKEVARGEREPTKPRAELEEQREDIARGKDSPDVDWSAIRDDIESEGDRISELTSNGVAGEIQQKVRDIEERTDRATGEHKDTDREFAEQQRLAKAEHEQNLRDIYRKPKSRDFDIDL